MTCRLCLRSECLFRRLELGVSRPLQTETEGPRNDHTSHLIMSVSAINICHNHYLSPVIKNDEKEKHN